jgi:hypothetical protein
MTRISVEKQISALVKAGRTRQQAIAELLAASTEAVDAEERGMQLAEEAEKRFGAKLPGKDRVFALH